MKKLEDIRTVVQTIADQIVAAPVGSVTVVHYYSTFGRTGGEPRYSDALVKTGSDGYKAAYYEHSGYLHADTVDNWVRAYPEGEFYLIEGPQGLTVSDR